MIKPKSGWEDRAFKKFGVACPDGWITFLRKEIDLAKHEAVKECLEELDKWAYEKFVVKYGDEIMTGKPFYLELTVKIRQAISAITNKK